MRPLEKFLRLGCVVLAIAVIAFLALRSSPAMREVPWIPRHIAYWADSHGVSRNIVAFFGLGLVVLLAFSRAGWVFMLLCLLAAGLELAQIWIPGRQFDAADIVASIAGLALAWPAAWAITRVRREKKC